MFNQERNQRKQEYKKQKAIDKLNADEMKYKELVDERKKVQTIQ